MIRKVNGVTNDPSNEHRASALDETRLIIVEALRNGDVIRPDALATIIASSFPDSGLSEAQIAAGLFEAAAEARVQVQPSQVELLRSALKRAETIAPSGPR